MARIKAVLNERRLAYEGAVKLHAQNREEILEKEAAREAEERANTVAAPEQPKIAESAPASLAASGLLGGAEPEVMQQKQDPGSSSRS